MTLPLSVERFSDPFQPPSIVIDPIERLVKASPKFADSITSDALKLSLAVGEVPRTPPWPHCHD